jgi:hypothetical protein
VDGSVHSHCSKSRKLAVKYSNPLSEMPLSFGTLLGSLVIVGLGGTMSGGIANKHRSVSRSFPVGMGASGLVWSAVTLEFIQLVLSTLISLPAVIPRYMMPTAHMQIIDSSSH